ncbi:transcription termination factor 3, mitochondrial-like [Portunus trituberculatus]|uniref:transcription termination factor 3, mitochondrial-like n=1 Tax=Portunus trituberculatus TaxID=210409 RepID=UPI001E1CC857|nr:transcription termination factor 3, mitochondrial-like [Portunus trituberculatus]
MNHTVGAVFGLAKPLLKYSPALYRQASTAVFKVQQEKCLLDAITKGDCAACCYKNAIRYYSLRSNSYTKEHQRKRHVLMSLRTLTSPAPGDALGVKGESEVSVAVVEDVSPAKLEEGEWINEMQWVKSQESNSVLLPPKDVSDIDVLAPELRPTFNLAAYVNKSATLQQLVKLGVDLSTWDARKNVNSFILPLDFERDMKKYIVFLHDLGILADDLGRWLTVNPYIFQQSIDDLEARTNYLEFMKFSEEDIVRIISKNPYWLLFSTVRIDKRLGIFQQSFELTDNEVRYLATKQPRLITYKYSSIKMTTFSVVEEMGFEKSEVKSLLLAKPRIWMAGRDALMRRFDFAHNHMGLSHQQIVQFPHVLLTRDFRMRQRHGFLKLLGRDQYDPSKPNYVSPLALVSGTDAEFCLSLAKSSVQAFNDFLKTL